MGDNLQDEIQKSIPLLTKSAPHWVVLLLVVAAFLYYNHLEHEMNAKESSLADVVAIQRIEACHAVQSDSIAAMVSLRNTLDVQTRAFEKLTRQIEIKNRDK